MGCPTEELDLMTSSNITELHCKYKGFKEFADRFCEWCPGGSVSTEFIRLSHMVIPHVREFYSNILYEAGVSLPNAA